MFRCQQCGIVTPPRTSSELVTTEIRPHSYPPRRKVMREIVFKKHLKQWEQADDPGGTGHEIVRQIRVCPSCKRAIESGIAPQPSEPVMLHVRRDISPHGPLNGQNRYRAVRAASE
jgi:hypothetical protein